MKKGDIITANDGTVYQLIEWSLAKKAYSTKVTKPDGTTGTVMLTRSELEAIDSAERSGKASGIILPFGTEVHTQAHSYFVMKNGVNRLPKEEGSASEFLEGKQLMAYSEGDELTYEIEDK